MSTFLWTTVIAYSLYKTITLKDFSQQRMLPYHIYVWGVALILALIPIKYYGPTIGWCWITSTDQKEFDPGTALRLFCFYVPLWLAVLFNTVAYASVTRSVHRMLRETDQAEGTSQRLMSLAQRLRWYPMILVVAYFWATVNRIYESFNPGHPLFWLIFLQAAFRSAEGLMNSLAYGYNPAVRQAWKKELLSDAGLSTVFLPSELPFSGSSEATGSMQEPAPSPNQDGHRTGTQDKDQDPKADVQNNEIMQGCKRPKGVDTV
eukprot:CAMPEP_0113952118 /NCGR_PEP_ID=MMETSP1339-20121228/89845_1 /TAXON_ID=94617 /ORGANISM="Fibrocapsa japonica" /LENGTH=261 /DNA_ID=CAMNT_0000960651 /DNA_START=12 /DNA_END=797 /DNA_ORIENTATION=+ /assembly_acc=CAM_ASM_000762